MVVIFVNLAARVRAHVRRILEHDRVLDRYAGNRRRHISMVDIDRNVRGTESQRAIVRFHASARIRSRRRARHVKLGIATHDHAIVDIEIRVVVCHSG